MLYHLSGIIGSGQGTVKDLGRHLGDVFGYDDIWRFRSFKKNIITSDRNSHKIAYVEIDRPEDCVYFELTFEKARRA